MSSGLPLKADTARCSWHVANVPDTPMAIQPSISNKNPRLRDRRFGVAANNTG
jgi:hypothetical protein